MAAARARARAIFWKGQRQLTYLTYNFISENNEDEKRKKFGRTKVEHFFQVSYSLRSYRIKALSNVYVLFDLARYSGGKNLSPNWKRKKISHPMNDKVKQTISGTAFI